MARSAEGVREDVAQAISELAGRVTDALTGNPEDNDVLGVTGVVAPFVEAADDQIAALGAVRVLGADALALPALAGTPPYPADAAVLSDALHGFPLTADGHTTPGAPAGQREVLVWHDWAVAELLARAEEPPRRVPPPATGVPRPEPETVPEWRRQDAGPAVPGAELRWQDFSVAMAQLAGLVMPGLESPVHQAARRYRLPLARGACWAAMRRDHAMAARLGRWLAYLRARGEQVPFDPGPFLDHVLLVGGVEARTVLDAVIGRRLLARGRAVPGAPEGARW